MAVALKHIERRSSVEMRVEGRRLEGYAATFGVEARIGNFRETIARGAFANSLSGNSDIVALMDHDPSRLLARTKSGTLELREDDKGLAFSLNIPDTQLGRDLLTLAERRDLGGMSFGFTVDKNGERWTGNRRELRSIKLREVSVVSAWPAYTGTSVQARAWADTPRLNLARLYLEAVS